MLSGHFKGKLQHNENFQAKMFIKTNRWALKIKSRRHPAIEVHTFVFCYQPYLSMLSSDKATTLSDTIVTHFHSNKWIRERKIFQKPVHRWNIDIHDCACCKPIELHCTINALDLHQWWYWIEQIFRRYLFVINALSLRISIAKWRTVTIS